MLTSLSVRAATFLLGSPDSQVVSPSLLELHAFCFVSSGTLNTRPAGLLLQVLYSRAAAGCVDSEGCSDCEPVPLVPLLESLRAEPLSAEPLSPVEVPLPALFFFSPFEHSTRNVIFSCYPPQK